MTTELLREFQVLSRVESINRAADLLFISQPVLTRHIQEMEKELGAALFVRSARGITLTDAGRYLAARLPALLEACDSAASQLRRGGLPVRGSLRVACSHELSYASHIRIFAGRFLRRYTDLRLTFDVISGAMPLSILRSYDVVISPCLYPELPPETRVDLLQRHSIYAYVWPGHRLMSRQSVTLSELAGETLLVPYADEPFGPYARNWQLAERQTHGALACHRVSNLAAAIFLKSVDNAGILLGPRYVRSMMTTENAVSSLAVPVSDSECCFEEYLYTPAYGVNGAARLFHDELAAACRITPAGDPAPAGSPLPRAGE